MRQRFASIWFPCLESSIYIYIYIYIYGIYIYGMSPSRCARGAWSTRPGRDVSTSGCCVRSCASFAAAPESHLRTVRAPRTTSERPILGYSRGCWLGQFWGTKVHVGLQRLCVWRSGLVGAVWRAVNLVAGGQSGCGATWPVWGGCALSSSGDPRGGWAVLSGTECLSLSSCSHVWSLL